MSKPPVRVLLVEDDEDDAVLARQLLREIDPDGYELDWVADFESGLERLSAGGYDVCLIDYQLGPHDGVEFIGRAIELGAGAPMILLTGMGDRAVDVAAMNAGAADFLSKHQLSAALLERAIRYAIAQKRAEQQRIRLLMEQAARAEAEAANRAKDRFLAVLSHELRTPLAAVVLNVNALQEEAGLSDSARELLAVVKRNVDLEARLIDDLLDLTRITRGKLELRHEIVDIHELIHDAVRCCCGPDIGEKQLLVQVRTEGQQHHVWGDPARLQQVFWNLIKNAVKFTPPGGRIDIATHDLAGDRLAIEVRDSGIGIASEALPRIFNAFEQAGPAITREFGGLGLGLAISRALIERHGGSIRAESPGPGAGATFRVELPASPPQSTQIPSTRRGRRSAARGVSILLVEDHPDTARAMQRLLGRRGHSVQTAATMAEALRTADCASFEVLISDIGLPDGSGLELMRRLLAARPI